MTRRGHPWPPPIVARVKAACVLHIPYKVTSRMTGVPVNTIKLWAAGRMRSEVDPDISFAENLRALFASNAMK